MMELKIRKKTEESAPKTKKLPLFWTVYGGVTALILVVMITALCLLHSYLSALEACQPIHPAQEIFQKYFASGNFMEAMTVSNFKVGEFEDLKAAADLLCEKKEGNELRFYAASAGQGEARYNVILVSPDQDGEQTPVETGENGIAVEEVPATKIATMRFVQTGEAGKWGFVPYEFADMEIFLEAEESVRVTLPSTSHLTLNGKSVSEDFIVEKEDHPFNAFLPEGVPGIQLCTYEIKGLFQTPDLSSTDRDGIAEVLRFEEEDGGYVAELNYNADLQSAYGQRILDGMHEYAKYIQNDGSMGRVAPYFDTASLFYRNIYMNLSQFVWDHNGYEFQNDVVEKFYAFDENTFVCHISFDHVLHLRGREDYVDVLDMMVFARKKGNNFYIYDRIVQ